MKTSFYLLFVLIVLFISQARADSFAGDQWGVVSNHVQMSIALDGGNRKIKINGQFQLLIQVKNLGLSNTWSYVGAAANSEPANGLHCVIISPSGREISPNVKFRGDAGMVFYLSPGTTNSFRFDLSSICKFNETGTYKIIAQKIISQNDGKNSYKSWTIISNPLLVTVVPAK